MTNRKPGTATGLVHGGRRKEWRGRLVNVPVERASTILFDNVDELQRARPGLGQWNYGLQRPVGFRALESVVPLPRPRAMELRTPGHGNPLVAVRGADRARARCRGNGALFLGTGRCHRSAACRALDGR